MSEPRTNELSVVPQSGETPARKGFQVIIADQQSIFRSIPTVTLRETPSVLIQYNDIEDDVCGSVFTVMRCYNHKSTYNPGTYEFDAEVDLKGKKFNALSLRRGYFARSQIKRIIGDLKIKGYKGDYKDHISISSYNNFQSLRICDNEGRKYHIKLGFATPITHRKWIDKQIAWEEKEVAPGHYMVHEQELKNNLHNDNIEFSSQPFNYPEDLKDTDSFTFSQNLVGFARAYADFLNALYASMPATPPNKVLTIRP